MNILRLHATGDLRLHDELFSTPIYAVDLGKQQAGMTVGMFGCGPIGLLIDQLAGLSGARNITAVVPGDKVILCGIPSTDETSFTTSMARRKGLTTKLVRCMKPTYPRAIELVSRGLVDVRSW